MKQHNDVEKNCYGSQQTSSLQQGQSITFLINLTPLVVYLHFCEHSNKQDKCKLLHSLCRRNKSVKMSIILIQDFSGAGLSGRLQTNNDALCCRKTIHVSNHRSAELPEAN